MPNPSMKDVVLEAYLNDNAKARELTPEGTYERIRPKKDEQSFDSQTFFSTHSL